MVPMHAATHSTMLKRAARTCGVVVIARGTAQKASPDLLVQHRATLRKLRLPSAPLLDRRLPVDFHAATSIVQPVPLLHNARVRILTLQGDGSAARDGSLCDGLRAAGAKLPALDETMDFEVRSLHSTMVVSGMCTRSVRFEGNSVTSCRQLIRPGVAAGCSRIAKAGASGATARVRTTAFKTRTRRAQFASCPRPGIAATTHKHNRASCLRRSA